METPSSSRRGKTAKEGSNIFFPSSVSAMHLYRRAASILRKIEMNHCILLKVVRLIPVGGEKEECVSFVLAKSSLCLYRG